MALSKALESVSFSLPLFNSCCGLSCGACAVSALCSGSDCNRDNKFQNILLLLKFASLKMKILLQPFPVLHLIIACPSCLLVPKFVHLACIVYQKECCCSVGQGRVAQA